MEEGRLDFFFSSFMGLLSTARRCFSRMRWTSYRRTEALNGEARGSCISPTVGALPDAIIIMVTAKSQDEVDAGMAMLVGSNALLLTVPFFIATFVGRRAFVKDDISKKFAADYEAEITKDRPSCSKAFLLRTGVSLYPDVTEQAQMIVISLLPLVVMQWGIFFLGGAACESQTGLPSCSHDPLVSSSCGHSLRELRRRLQQVFRVCRVSPAAQRVAGGNKIALAANFVESANAKQIEKALGASREVESIDVLSRLRTQTSTVGAELVSFDAAGPVRPNRAKSEGAFDLMEGVDIEMAAYPKFRAITERSRPKASPRPSCALQADNFR